jgi:hypothetical protein
MVAMPRASLTGFIGLNPKLVENFYCLGNARIKKGIPI